MTLLNEEQKRKLQNLYSQNKFSELEIEIELISDFKTRSPFLANLLGVSKLKKKIKSDKDWIDARNLFLDSYKKAPNYDDALCNYAHISVKLRDYAHAYEELLKRRKKSYNPKVNEALARIYFFEGEIDKEVELFKENEKNNHLTTVSASHLLTSMNYSSNFNQLDYLEYCEKINEKFSISEQELKKLNKYKYDDNLKIGFISPDFKEHSIYYFLKSVIKPLQNKSYKVVAFNLRKKEELDHVSKKIERDCDEWVDLSELNDLESANLIIEKKINVLFDLAGHFARNRFKILKYKPSPVQVIWMGYVNSTGIKEIDYIIADKHLIKENEEKFYTEKVLKMPYIWNCHSGIDKNLKINDLPFSKNKFLTFGCFNNSSKISEKCIITWSKILNEVPNSKLLIKAPSQDAEIAQKKILEKFIKNSINSNKIIFEKHRPNREDHLKMYNLVDISLDTFPYPGVTTSFESIWMGVPVLTMKGDNFVSRCGESINMNLDFKNFIAENENDYINKAKNYSMNISEMIEIRKTIRKKALNSSLFDQHNFGQNFISLIQKIWFDFKN